MIGKSFSGKSAKDGQVRYNKPLFTNNSSKAAFCRNTISVNGGLFLNEGYRNSEKN